MLVSVLGDSISTYEGYIPPNYKVYYDEDRQKINGLTSVYDTWWAKVNQYLKAYLCVNNSFSGSKVSGEFPSASSEKRASALHKMEHYPDVILVYMGTNDFGFGVPLETFAKDYRKMLERLRKNYPSARILCATIARSYMQGKPDWKYPEMYGGTALEEYNQAIREAVNERDDIVLMDLPEEGIHYETLDGTHPTRRGHEELAQMWIGCLEKIKLLQNEYEEYFNELELIQRQYNQEEAYYFIINKLIRDSIDDKDISVRDVHKLIRANDFPGRNSYLRGYAGQVPDFVILDNDFDESKGEGQSGKVYGCVEIKPFSLENKKLYSNYIRPIENLLERKKSFQLVHEKLCQNRIKIEFGSSKKKEEFVKNCSKKYEESIPISLENGDIKGKVFLCGGNKDLCLKIEENQSIEFKDNEIKPLKIQMQNDKVVLVPRTRKNENMECEYLVELKSKKIKKEKFSQENKECCNTIVCELLKELIGFKKVIFTNGYQWILIQCSETEFEKEKDKNGIKGTSPITVKDFQCKSLANFYPEPKDEKTFEKLKKEQCQDMSDMSKKLDAEKQKLKIPLTEFQTDEDFKAWTGMTFAELQQHNFEQWLHLKLEINRIFKEAKSQSKQGEEKIGNDE